MNPQALAQWQMLLSALSKTAPARFASSARNTLLPEKMSDIVAGSAYAMRHPIDSASMLGGAMQDASQASFEKMYGADNPFEAVGYGAAGAIPMIGPMAAHAGEQIGSGDVAGGLGTASAMLLPTLLGGKGKVAPPAAKAGAAAMDRRGFLGKLATAGAGAAAGGEIFKGAVGKLPEAALVAPEPAPLMMSIMKDGIRAQVEVRPQDAFNLMRNKKSALPYLMSDVGNTMFTDGKTVFYRPSSVIDKAKIVRGDLNRGSNSITEKVPSVQFHDGFGNKVMAADKIDHSQQIANLIGRRISEGKDVSNFLKPRTKHGKTVATMNQYVDTPPNMYSPIVDGYNNPPISALVPFDSKWKKVTATVGPNGEVILPPGLNPPAKFGTDPIYSYNARLSRRMTKMNEAKAAAAEAKAKQLVDSYLERIKAGEQFPKPRSSKAKGKKTK